MSMTVDDYEWTQNLSHEVCGVITSVEQCALVRAQCMCAPRNRRSQRRHWCHLSCIGELLVVRVVPLVVCDDAVVRRTLVLIAFAVAFVFVVAIFQRILLYWRYIVYTTPSVTVNCCWLLPNFEL